MGVSYKKILPFTSTEMITVSGVVSRTKFFSLGKSTLIDVVTTGIVIKKMIKSTNITSTKGVVLISLMISSSLSEPMFIAMMGLQRLAHSSLDVVFLDPPFEGEYFEKALQAAAKAVVPEGWVYLEAPVHWTDEAVQACGLQAVKHMKAGAVHAHLLQRPFEG